MMRSCESVRAELKAYCDKELGFFTRARVRNHLLHCTPCQAELRALQRLGEELRRLDQQIVPRPELRARILQSLPDVPPESAHKTHPRKFFRGLALAGASGVAILLMMVFYRMNAPHTTQQADRIALAPRQPKPLTKIPAERPRIAMGLPEEHSTRLHQETTPSKEQQARSEFAQHTPRVKSKEAPTATRSSGIPAKKKAALHPMADNRQVKDRPSQPPMTPAAPMSPEAAVSMAKTVDKAGHAGGPEEASTFSAKAPLALSMQSGGKEETIRLSVDDLEARLAQVEDLAKAEEAFVGPTKRSTGIGEAPSASVMVLVPADRAPTLKKKLLALGIEEAGVKKFAPLPPQASRIALRRAQATEERNKALQKHAPRFESAVRQDSATTRESAPGSKHIEADTFKPEPSAPLVRFHIQLQQVPLPASTSEKKK